MSRTLAFAALGVVLVHGAFAQDGSSDDAADGALELVAAGPPPATEADWRPDLIRGPHRGERTSRSPLLFLRLIVLQSGARLIAAANLLPGQRAAQRGADVADVERSGAEWEDAPHQRQDADHLAPSDGDQAEGEESHARDDAKDAPSRAVEKPRET